MSEIVGHIAACLTTASFLPQAILVLRTGQTEGISLAMYSLFTAGVAMWLVYGLLINSLPIIIANIITLILASLILGIKARAVIKAR